MAEMNLGLNLKRYRLAKGLTQDELARSAGVSRLAYQKIETGESEPRVSTLQAIAHALNVKLQNLLIPLDTPSKVRFRAQRKLKTRDEIILSVSRSLKDYNFLEDQLNRKQPYRLEQLAKELRTEPPGQTRAKSAAARARERLDLKDEDLIRDICGLLEKGGIKVITKNVATGGEGFFGLAISPSDGGPAIVVNTWERISVERWIFTAVHELGHLLMHLDSFDVNQIEEDTAEEAEADVFAGYFLMPEKVFVKEWEETRGLPFIDRVMKLKRIFRVSYKTVLYRLDKTLLGSGVWVRYHTEYKNRTKRSLGVTEEPTVTLRAEEGSYQLTPPDFLSDRLHRLVREAVVSERITLNRGADILDLSLAEIRDLAASWADV